MPIFSSKRRDQRKPTAYAQVGSYRFSGKTVTGAGLVEPIPGFLYCNGFAVSRTTYKALFDLIGTTFGVGDNSTTFNLPDWCGRFMAGQTDGVGAASDRMAGLTIGTVVGAERVTLTAAQIPAHSHNVGTLAVSGSSGTDGQHGAGTVSYPWSGGLTSGMAPQAEPNNSTPTSIAFDGGTSSTDSHTHSSLTGSVGDGTADGVGSGAHQNVHPHQAFGGVLIGY